MNNPHSIRVITEDDLDSCVTIFIREWSQEPYNEKWTRDAAKSRLTEIFKDSDGTSLCISIGDEIVGFAFCRLLTWYDGKHGCIEELIIDGKYQNLGHGKALLNAVEENFKKKGVVQIELLSSEQAKAFHFFHGNGFHTCEWKYLIKEL